MILKSINYWSFPGGLEGAYDVIECLERAKEFGFQAVELCIGESGAFGLDVTQTQCEAIRQKANDLGIAIPSVASGLYWQRALGDIEEANRVQALSDLKKMLKITGWLGARTLLTIPGAVEVFFMPDRPRIPYAHVYKHATEGVKQALETAEQSRVRMGIENVWNKFLLSPLEMAQFIDQFASPYVGAYVDVANILPYGYAEDWLRTLESRVVGIHFKDFRRSVGVLDGFVDLLEGDVNWPEVMAAIRVIDYDGPVVAEMIPYYAHHPMTRIANTSRAMDSILGAV